MTRPIQSKLSLFDCVIQHADHVIWQGGACSELQHAKATSQPLKSRVDGDIKAGQFVQPSNRSQGDIAALPIINAKNQSLQCTISSNLGTSHSNTLIKSLAIKNLTLTKRRHSNCNAQTRLTRSDKAKALIREKLNLSSTSHFFY